MNLAWYIAKRYRKPLSSFNAIHIISRISVIGIAAGTMGLIIVLSVFNGFQGLILNLYNSFDPQIQISPTKGKTFNEASVNWKQLKAQKEVKVVCKVLEENVLLRLNERQYIATMKGVSSEFEQMTGLDSMMLGGKLLLQRGDYNYAVPGAAIAQALGVNLDDPFALIDVYVPRKGNVSSYNPEDAFSRRVISTAGVFAVQQDFDSKYFLVPLRFAKSLLDSPEQLSYIELGLADEADEEQVKIKLQKMLGPAYTVKTRLELHEFLYKIMKSEKWAVFLIISLIIAIAAFNIVASLSMLIIDKGKDISILHSMGMELGTIKKIFWYNGIFISIKGAIIGLLLGLVVCLAQMVFGLVKIPGQTFVVDVYPVILQWADFAAVAAIVLAIGALAAALPLPKLVPAYANKPPKI